MALGINDILNTSFVGCYSMHGSPEGTVGFGHRGYESNSSTISGSLVKGLNNASMAVVKDDVDDDDEYTGLTFTDDDDDLALDSITNSTTLDIKTPVSAPQLEYIPTYNGETMAVQEVFDARFWGLKRVRLNASVDLRREHSILFRSITRVGGRDSTIRH